MCGGVHALNSRRFVEGITVVFAKPKSLKGCVFWVLNILNSLNVVVHVRTWHDRFVRQIRDKLSEQEKVLLEELQKGASAREGFRKVQQGRYHTVNDRLIYTMILFLFPASG